MVRISACDFKHNISILLHTYMFTYWGFVFGKGKAHSTGSVYIVMVGIMVGGLWGVDRTMHFAYLMCSMFRMGHFNICMILCICMVGILDHKGVRQAHASGESFGGKVWSRSRRAAEDLHALFAPVA